MSDDEKAAEAAKAAAEAKAQEAAELRKKLENMGIKVYDDTEFKKVVGERDEAKKRAREIDEAKRKEAEAKLAEEGKFKELLDQRNAELEQAKQREAALAEKARMYEENQARMREQALAKITDSKARAIAEKLPTVADVMEFADLQTTTRAGVDSTKGARGGTGGDGNPHLAKPGESFTAWQARMLAEGKMKG